MQKFDRKPENESRTLDRPSKSSRQPPIGEILQQYKVPSQENTTVPDNRSASVIQMGRFTDFYLGKYGEMPAQKGEPIPRIIHRFWAGGPIHPSDLDNIMQMQQRLVERNEQLGRAGPRWRQILWTSKSFNKEKSSLILPKQLDYLRSLGVEVINYEREFPRSKLPDIKHISDEVRLMALLKYGGTYMDMDVGVGDETFETDLYHRKEVGLGGGQSRYLPLLGSGFPFDEKKHSLEDEEERYTNQGYLWNYFFSSQKKNPFIAEMLQRAQTGEDAQQIMRDMFGLSDLFKNAYTPWDLTFCTQGSIDKKDSGGVVEPNLFSAPDDTQYFYRFALTLDDGDCFFRAILQALDGQSISPEIDHGQLRRFAYNEMRGLGTPVPKRYLLPRIWVDDLMAQGVIAYFQRTRGIQLTINIHYLMTDGLHFDTVTYGTGPIVLNLVMRDGYAHFTYAMPLDPPAPVPSSAEEETGEDTL